LYHTVAEPESIYSHLKHNTGKERTGTYRTFQPLFHILAEPESI
jgi:hypothetical protein